MTGPKSGAAADRDGIVDDLDRHLALAGSIERAAFPMAMYVAWCANLGLLAPEFEASNEAAVLRLRYRDVSPVAFFTATCGGRLEERALSQTGRAFTRDYYPRLLDDLVETFGADFYSADDDWAHYDRLAAVLTHRYMGESRTLASRDDQRRKWWQFWR